MLSNSTASIDNEKLRNSTALNEKFLGTEKDLPSKIVPPFMER